MVGADLITFAHSDNLELFPGVDVTDRINALDGMGGKNELRIYLSSNLTTFSSFAMFRITLNIVTLE